MKIDINVNDFITEAHKKQIEKKIEEAINNVDPSKLSKELEDALLDQYWRDFVADCIYDSNLQSVLLEQVNKKLKTIFQK